MARASPEMRPGSHHDGWAATPQAADQPHYVRRHSVAAGLLPVMNFHNNLARTPLGRNRETSQLSISGPENAGREHEATRRKPPTCLVYREPPTMRRSSAGPELRCEGTS